MAKNLDLDWDGIRIVQSGKQKALEDLNVAFQYLKGVHKKDGACSDRTR